MQPHYPPEQQPALPVSDEINLIELVWFVWDSKITIITSALMCFAAAFGYMLNTPKTYTSNTLLIPSSSFEVNRYMNLSLITGIEINAEELMSSYRQNWLRPGVIEDSLVSSGLINQSDFQSEKDFEEKVALMAASVTLEKVATSDKDLAANPDLATHWQIIFETSQPDAWLEALRIIDKQATLKTKEYYTQVFETWSNIEATKRDFAIQDVEKELEIGLTIQSNAKRNRLAFLNEQNEIAMALGVANPSIGSQNFTSSAGVLMNVETDNPFYLRGHKAISKEIELIKGRQNDIEHSDQLLEIETRLLKLRRDETVERARALFNETPLAEAGEFTAAQISIEATKFKSNSKNSLIFAVSLVAGGFIGIFVAALNLALQRRKTLETAGA